MPLGAQRNRIKDFKTVVYIKPYSWMWDIRISLMITDLILMVVRENLRKRKGERGIKKGIKKPP